MGKLNVGCFVQPSEIHLLLLTSIIFMSLCSEQKILIVSVGKLNEGCFVQPSEMHLLLLTLIIFSSLCSEQ